MPIYEHGDVRIHYEDTGSGFPLLLIPGGGLNSSNAFWTGNAPFHAPEALKDDFRCITADLRNANSGQSSGPVATEKAWDSYAEDQLGVMDSLGIREFAVMGFCIGGPMIFKLIEKAGDRIVAAVLAQPSGFRPDNPDVFWRTNTTGWGPQLIARRPGVTMALIEAHLTNLYRSDPDFVFTVSRDFARSVQQPMLVLPDDIEPHPWQTSMDIYKLVPNCEVSMYPWKDTPEQTAAAVERVRSFLKAHTPALANR